MEKILVVDDLEDNRILLKNFLTDQNYLVCEASDGNMAYDQALSQKPDLILMDIVMPGLDGYEACKKIKQNPPSADIPVIFLSSLTEIKDRLKGFEVGGVDFFTKFGDFNELKARIAAQLKIRFLTKSLKEANQELQKKQSALNEDLSSAAQIQQSLLPFKKSFQHSCLEIAWDCAPCQFIGGDIFNYIHLDDDHVAFYIIDVCGHGVPSAMIAVSVSQHLRELIDSSQNTSGSKLFFPGQLLKDLNHEFSMNRFGRYFTIFYLVLNVKTGRAFYSLAGHPPAILVHKDQSYELLDVGGPVVGIDDGINFDEGSKVLLPGDKIIFYTDGVTECENPQQEFYGVDRFVELVEANRHQSVEEIIRLVFAQLHQFSQNEPIKDDTSLMCVAYEPADSSKFSHN